MIQEKSKLTLKLTLEYSVKSAAYNYFVCITIFFR